MQVVPVSTRISPWKSSLKRMEPFQLDALYSYYSMLGALRSSLNFTPENITYELKKPILFIGLGQEYKDFQKFDAEKFISLIMQ